MNKKFFVLVICCVISVMLKAEVAKYCMSYTDFVEGNWKPVSELTEGRTKQLCQIKSDNHCVYFKTGDKASDEVLKKQAFAVMYGNQLYVNCRNLREDGVCLETSRYVQAVRYGDNKLCVMAYRTNGWAALAEVGTGLAAVFVNDTWVSLGLLAGSTAFGIACDKLSSLACYLVESDANAKGKTPITRINDAFMEHLLVNDAPLLEQYKAIKTKYNRQSAANILPILMEKGLVASAQ